MIRWRKQQIHERRIIFAEHHLKQSAGIHMPPKQEPQTHYCRILGNGNCHPRPAARQAQQQLIDCLEKFFKNSMNKTKYFHTSSSADKTKRSADDNARRQQKHIPPEHEEHTRKQNTSPTFNSNDKHHNEKKTRNKSNMVTFAKKEKTINNMIAQNLREHTDCSQQEIRIVVRCYAAHPKRRSNPSCLESDWARCFPEQTCPLNKFIDLSTSTFSIAYTTGTTKSEDNEDEGDSPDRPSLTMPRKKRDQV